MHAKHFNGTKKNGYFYEIVILVTLIRWIVSHTPLIAC